MLGLDPSISGRKRLQWRLRVLRFSGLRFAPPENDGQAQNASSQFRLSRIAELISPTIE